VISIDVTILFGDEEDLQIQLALRYTTAIPDGLVRDMRVYQ
jgi:hypothetical protein